MIDSSPNTIDIFVCDELKTVGNAFLPLILYINVVNTRIRRMWMFLLHYDMSSFYLTVNYLLLL